MRRQQLFLSLMILATAVNVWGQITGEFTLAAISKIIIIPALAACVLTEGNPSKIYLLALFFSWLGDSFLIPEGTVYFALGIGSFWITQLLYCRLMLTELNESFFTQLRKKKHPWVWHCFTRLSTGDVAANYTGLKRTKATRCPLRNNALLYRLFGDMLCAKIKTANGKTFGHWVCIIYCFR